MNSELPRATRATPGHDPSAGPHGSGTWALDLDGVVWLAGKGIVGSASAVASLRHAGKRVIFLTNNSGPLVSGHVEALASAGIACTAEDVVSSAQAAASLVSEGQRVALVGDQGPREALEAKKVNLVEADDGPEVVLVGRTTELDYWQLARAATAVRTGARFIATNTDSTFPAGPGVLLPGAGALVAFVSTAAGRTPEVAGKPHGAMAALVAQRFGAVEMMVGDRADTDGRFARLIGARFGLVLSGVTSEDDLPVDPQPDVVASDLAELVDQTVNAH